MKKTIRLALLLCLVSLACMLTLTACDIADILGNNSQETTPEETSTEEISPEHPSQHIMGEWIPLEEPTYEGDHVVCRRNCTECDYEETKAFLVETDYDPFDPPIEHNQHVMGEWFPTHEVTCGNEYVICHRDCTECHWGESMAFACYIPHSYVITEVVSPTPSMNGYTVYTCSVCGDSRVSDFVPATDSSIGLSYALYNLKTTCIVTGIGTCTDTEIHIPKTIDGYTVTNIGEGAFLDCSNITSITIPDSVTTIGKNAFQGCSGITTIIFEGTVEQWGDICLDYDWYVDTSANEVKCSDGGWVYGEIGG